MAQSRSYCFTLNNPLPQEVESLRLLAAEVSYIIFQRERGENGTEHIQGFVQFPRKLRLQGAIRHLGRRCHCEILRGSPRQAADYCRKEETRIDEPFESGQLVVMGARRDLEAFNVSIKGGLTDAQLIERHLNEFYQFHKVVDRVRLAFRKPRNWEMENNVYFGRSGSGKTRRAYEEAGEDNYFVSKGDNNQVTWWDGYHGQATVIIDDFYGWLPWSFMLRLLDRYPFSVQIKGGTVPFTSKKILITSNTHPNTWYKNVPNNDMTPLLRRINKIEEMNYFIVYMLTAFANQNV